MVVSEHVQVFIILQKVILVNVWTYLSSIHITTNINLVVSGHGQQRFFFPAPVFKHLARSFNKISFHRSSAETSVSSLYIYKFVKRQFKLRQNSTRDISNHGI